MDKNNTKFYPVSSSNHLANAIEELIIDKRKVVEMCLASSKVDAYNKNIAKQKLQELMHELCGDKYVRNLPIILSKINRVYPQLLGG